jgi:hypothetical protein
VQADNRRASPCLGDACARGSNDSHSTWSAAACRSCIPTSVRRHLERSCACCVTGKLVASAWAAGSSRPTRAVAEILDRYARPVDSLDEAAWFTGRHGVTVLRKTGFTSVSGHSEFFGGEFADSEDALGRATASPTRSNQARTAEPEPPGPVFSEARRVGRASLPGASPSTSTSRTMRRPPSAAADSQLSFTARGPRHRLISK